MTVAALDVTAGSSCFTGVANRRRWRSAEWSALSGSMPPAQVRPAAGQRGDKMREPQGQAGPSGLSRHKPELSLAVACGEWWNITLCNDCDSHKLENNFLSNRQEG